MSSLADNLLNAHNSGSPAESAPASARPLVDLKKLPQLKATSSSSSSSSSSSTGAGSSAAPPAAAAAASARTPQIANTGVANVTVTLLVPEPEQVRAAAEQVMQDAGVKIAIAKSASPKHATFMITGPVSSIERAKAQLEEALQPRVRETVEIPQSARSALIGARGANLRAIEQRHRVQLDLQRSAPSVWSLERFPVVITGGASSVEAARKDVLACVDEQRQVTSVRRFPAEFPDISTIVFGSKRPVLQGTLANVLSEMEKHDRKIAEIERTYSRQTVPTNGIPLRTDLLVEEPLRALLSSPSTENSTEAEIVTVYAPANQLQAAVRQLESHLSSQTTQTIDISRAHGGDVAHARVLARYFSAVDLAGELSRTFGVVITLNGLVFTITGAKDAVQLARKEIVKRVNMLSPATLGLIRGMRHALVRKRAQEAIDELKEQLGSVTVTIGPSDELYLVYEDNGDDFAPSEEQIRQSVAAAHSKLQFLTELAGTLARKVVPLSPAKAAFVLKPVGPDAQELRSTLDVEIVERSGNGNGNGNGSAESAAAAAPTSEDDEDGEEETSSGVVISGTKDNVEAAVAAIPKLVQLSRAHSIRASHIEEFAIDAELVKQVVGRQGAQISQFRKEFDVKMEVDKQGKVSVQGIEQDVRNCVKAVLDFQRRLRDESVEELEIPQEYRSRLIGPKGKYVNRLRDKHQCIIRFPNEQAQDSNNLIYIRGPSKGVAAVKREFLELVEYERLQSYSETLMLPASVIPRIVGRGGLVVNSIKAESGAQIDIGNAPSSSSSSDANGNADAEVEVKVIGEKKKVAQAVSLIKKAAAVATDFAELSVSVEPRFWRRLVLERQQILEKAGAGAGENNAGRLLNIPNQNASRDAAVKIQGPVELSAKVEAAVKEFVADLQRKSQASGELRVPENRLRRVAGSMGSVRREAEEKFDVLVDVPNASSPNSTKLAAVTVTGESQKSVDEALAHLRSIALPESLSVKTVGSSWNGLRRAVQDKFGVRCQVRGGGGSQLPPPPPATGDDEVKLITITPDVSVEIEGETKEKCAEAAEYIKQKTPTTLAYVLIPESKIGQVIGPGGKNIRATRQKTGCSIEVSASGPAVVLGQRADVEAAVAALTN